MTYLYMVKAMNCMQDIPGFNMCQHTDYYDGEFVVFFGKSRRKLP